MPSKTTHAASASAQQNQCKLVDPRAPRFGAAITTVMLALILVLGPTSPIAVALLIAQVIAFGLGSLIGLRAHPYGWLFRKLVRPRLGPPSELEDEAPPRFAQAVGLGFGLVAAAGLVLGLDALFYAAVALALAAAFLNAAFNFCLGCEMYLLFKRIGAGNKTVTQH